MIFAEIHSLTLALRYGLGRSVTAKDNQSFALLAQTVSHSM